MANKRTQDSLNQFAGTMNRNNQDCLNILAGTSNRNRQDAANIWAGTTDLSTQNAINAKAGTEYLSIQDALEVITGGSTTPDALSGLVMWLKADAGVTGNDGVTAAADGETTAMWNDQSTAGRNATQGTVANRPTYHATGGANDLPRVTFDGTNDKMTFTSFGSTTVTAFYVAKNTDLSEGSTILGRQSATSSAMTAFAIGVVATTIGSSTTGSVGETSQFHMGGFIADGTQLTVFRNGAPGFPIPATGTFTVDKLGSSDASEPSFLITGDVCEIILYNRALTGVERVQIENYLSNKYGVLETGIA